MQKADTQFIVIGKIGATYGIRGWLKIQSYTEFGSDILQYLPWYIQNINESWETLQVEDGKVHGNGLIVKLAGLNTPEDAKLYTGRLIGIPRNQLPSLNEDEFYWSDLIGLTVIDTHGKVLGTVKYILETGSNDVIVIQGDKEYAIPYLKGSVILKIDLKKREILVDWELI